MTAVGPRFRLQGGTPVSYFGLVRCRRRRSLAERKNIGCFRSSNDNSTNSNSTRSYYFDLTLNYKQLCFLPLGTLHLFHGVSLNL